MRNLEIVYEDELLLVINKPAGLAVQGGKDVKVSLDKLLAEIRTPAPLLVHRLDKDTSGLLLVAKTKAAAADLSRLFGEEIDKSAENIKKSPLKRTSIVRQYTAICLGCPEKKEGIISEDITIRGNLKKSQTKYKVIKKIQDTGAKTIFSVLELTLGTGRMHQIRRHLAMTGNPVLGDDKYGDFKINKALRKTHGLKKLLLHSSRLVVDADEDGIHLDLRAPLPEYFDAFLKTINFLQ